MKIFLTGATGYIGGAVAARLIDAGHQVRGLVRDAGKAAALEARGIEPALGELDDAATLAREARAADGVVSAANADHAASVQALLAALDGSGKPLLHTSGSSVIADDARGNVEGQAVYDETTPFVVPKGRQARHALNQSLLAGAARGVRTIIVCPTLIYGSGRGLNPHSVQVPFLVRQAREHRVVRVIGRGLNRWSTVHIDDVAELYRLALERAPAGAFYFAENGESSFAEIGAAIAARLKREPVGTIDAQDAVAQWGEGKALYTFGSNSRVRAVRARRELGWQPRHGSVLDWIAREMDPSL
jgi:nucleoside-diphosphate-sugar epimerase